MPAAETLGMDSDINDQFAERHAPVVPPAPLSKDQGTAWKMPLLMGLVPVLLNSVFGESKFWVELVVFVVTGVWIYNLLKAPWTMYFNARNIAWSASERFFVLLIFVSPLVGAYCLHVAKGYFVGGQIFPHFNIPVFLLASLLQPLLFFLRHEPDSHGGEIATRISALEKTLSHSGHLHRRRSAEDNVDLAGISERISRLERRIRNLEGSRDSKLAKKTATASLFSAASFGPLLDGLSYVVFLPFRLPTKLLLWWKLLTAI